MRMDCLHCHAARCSRPCGAEKRGVDGEEMKGVEERGERRGRRGKRESRRDGRGVEKGEK